MALFCRSACGLRRYAFSGYLGGFARRIRKNDLGRCHSADFAGLSTNTISKLVLAGTSGGRSFAVRVIPGLILVVLAAWSGALYALIGA